VQGSDSQNNLILKIIETPELKCEFLSEDEIVELDEIRALREIVLDVQNPPTTFQTST
jgi:hypothetical protein